MYAWIRKYYPYFILAFIFVILLIRNRYSFCWSDESLYVSHMYRLYQGDVFLRDEWNGSMLPAYVTFPLFCIYMFFKGSTESVYLFFRDVYVAAAFFTAVAVYRILSKPFMQRTALICSMCFLIYSRANICGCSYYNMGLMLFLLADCLFYHAYCLQKEKSCPGCAWMAGVCLGLSTIVNPYFVLFLLVLLLLLFRKEGRRCILQAAGACCLCGLVFALYYLNSIGLKEFSMLFFHGGRMETPSIPDKFIYWFVCMYGFFRKTIAVQGVVLGVQSYLACRRRKYYKLQFMLLMISFLCFGYNLYSCAGMLGGAYISLAFLGIQILPAAVWKRVDIYTVQQGILYFYVTGILLSITFETASNTGIDAAGIGFVVAAFGAVIILSENQYIDKKDSWKNVFLYVCIGSAIGITLFLRIFGVYRDDVLWKLKYKITQGPAKGLYTTEEHLVQYNNVYEDIREFASTDLEEYVFISRLAPWAYLCTSARCGAYSTWRLDISDPDLKLYYEDHPVPAYVFVLDASYGGYRDNYISTWGEYGDLTPNANDMSGYLADYMKEHGYQCIHVRSGILYRKRGRNDTI